MTTAAALMNNMPAEDEKPTVTPRKSHPQPAVDRIVLTGFMGSGKSTVGALLAEQLGWTFVDLDAEIERRCGLSVPAIFAELGEEQFRRHEASALASVLGRSHVVIALGGGAPETLGNRLMLEQTPATAVVFLQAPFDVLHDRCTRQATEPGVTTRPLLADREKARLRFEARQTHYLRIAPLRIETSALSEEATVEAVMALVPRRV